MLPKVIWGSPMTKIFIFVIKNAPKTSNIIFCPKEVNSQTNAPQNHLGCPMSKKKKLWGGGGAKCHRPV